MMAKVTQRTELGPLPALPTVRHARIERSMRLSPEQCAQLTLAEFGGVLIEREVGPGAVIVLEALPKSGSRWRFDG